MEHRKAKPNRSASPAQVDYAWLLWGRRVGHPQGDKEPLGCYASRDVALEAERMAKEHPNVALWDEFWVTPWRLATEPIVNFRMAMAS